MRLFLNISFILIFFSCSNNNTLSENGCQENLNFKRRYFNSINEIGQYYNKQKSSESMNKEDRKKFAKHVNILTKITGIKPNVATDYRFGYTDIRAFISDKQSWEKWYEVNKCDNLQWKE